MAEDVEEKKLNEEVVEGTDSGMQELGENDAAIAKKTKEQEEQKYVENLNKLNEAILIQTANIKPGEIKKVNSLTIEGTDVMKGSAVVKLNDVVIAMVQDGIINYNQNIEKPEVKKQLMELEKNLGEREEEKTEDDLKDVEDENLDNIQEDPEKETLNDEEEPETEEEQETEPEKSTLEPDPSWIELRPGREIDEMQTLAGIVKKNHKNVGPISRMFIAPKQNDPNRYTLIVEGKRGQYTKVLLEETEGNNPQHEQVTTMDNSGNNATKATPIQMLKINDRNMIMIFKGGKTNTSIHFGTRTDSDDYISSKIGGSRSFDLTDPSEKVKEKISGTRGNQSKGDDTSRAYDTINNFERQNLPDSINPAKDQDGIEVEEVDDFPKGIVDTLENNLKSLFEKRGMSFTNEAIETMAKAIVDGKDFKDAIIEGMKLDEGKTIPPDSAEKNGEEVYEALVNGEEYEQEEPGDRRRGV